MVRTDVLVIGAGQAGLSAAYHLEHTGTDHLVLDAESGPGGAWRHRWPSLTMEGVNGIRELPASVVPDVDSSAPASQAVPDYFAGYEQQFELNVRRPVTVRRVVDDGTRLVAATDAGEQISARALINATGSWNRPFWPWYPGRDGFAGWQLHTRDYPGADRFAGRRVVVIGGGISAVQLLMEIAPVAAEHRWVTRRPPVWVDREFASELGRAAVAMVEERVRRGLPPRSVVSVTGLPLTPAIREAREADVLQRFPVFAAIDADGVSWPDGSRFDADILFWCTGFRAALDHLTPLRLRGAGGGIAMDGTRTVADPRVHLVGYGPSASTIGANRAGRVAVREIRGMLGLADGPGRGPGRHAVVE
ncbi:MAG: FAD-dependent oxidoreductase [Nakamurella sp.]